MIRVIVLCISLVVSTAQAQTRPLEVEVLRTGAGSLFANYALIKGEKKAVLVDAPWTRADAHRVVAMILDSGRELETAFITHDHPDHFFSMEVITEAFPNAKVVAHPTVVADIWRSLPFKVKRWYPVLGANAPKRPTAPLPLEGETIDLEGRALKVLGPFQGDYAHSTALWAPSIGALFPGDLVFNEVFLWFGEHDAKAIQEWGNALDQLAALNPRTVVAGHSKPDLPFDASGLDYSRRYIAQWPTFVASSKNSAELVARVRKAYPNSIDVLGDFLLGNSARVAMGEEPAWQE
jgi:glyoxylase-like metal-dependent hydrolase (beta-lactamase superfamily II)